MLFLFSPPYRRPISSHKFKTKPPFSPPKSSHCRKQSGGGANDWAAGQNFGQSPSHHPSKKIAMSPSIQRPPVPAWSSDGSVSSGRQLSGPTPTVKSFSQPGGQTLP